VKEALVRTNAVDLFLSAFARSIEVRNAEDFAHWASSSFLSGGLRTKKRSPGGKAI
jgi:hypothetical protein